MVPTAPPLSTHHFLAGAPAIEKCLVEGDSTSVANPGVMADSFFQVGFLRHFFFFFPNHSVGLVFCFFFLLLCYQFQSTENNQCFSFRVTWAIDRASTRWTAMSLSLPHTSKNGTLRKKKKKTRSTGEKVHQLQFTKVWSCSGRFSLVGPSRHSERSKWDLASTYGTTASPKHLTCFFLCDIPFGRWCVNSCNKGFTINVK